MLHNENPSSDVFYVVFILGEIDETLDFVFSRENKVRFHSASALGPAPNEVGPDAHLAAVNRLPTDWLAYDEMTRLHRSAQVKSCTIISPVTIAMFAGPAKLPLEAVKEAECGLHCELTESLFLFLRWDSTYLNNKITRGQSNLTKSASRGPIPRLGVTPGGRKLYH